jgi:hypothetical protein
MLTSASAISGRSAFAFWIPGTVTRFSAKDRERVIIGSAYLSLTYFQVVDTCYDLTIL